MVLSVRVHGFVCVSATFVLCVRKLFLHPRLAYRLCVFRVLVCFGSGFLDECVMFNVRFSDDIFCVCVCVFCVCTWLRLFGCLSTIFPVVYRDTLCGHFMCYRDVSCGCCMLYHDTVRHYHTGLKIAHPPWEKFPVEFSRQLSRGTIVNRTYGTHKNLYIFLFSPTIFGPIYYGPP